MATTEVRIPDIGDVDDVTVAEVLVQAGDSVDAEQSLITLESDKATMEVPSPAAGTVVEVRVTEGDDVGEGAVILLLDATSADGASTESTASTPAAPADPEPAPEAPTTTSTASAPTPAPDPGGAPAPPPSAAAPPPSAPAPPPSAPAPPPGVSTALPAIDETSFATAYASPGVRRYARELGVDLGAISGSGRKGRITKEDVQAFVKAALAGGARPATAAGTVDGFAWPAMPDIDFAQFGPVEIKKLSRLRQASSRNLHRSWLHVPHVTQHEDADITEMDAFRKAHKEEAKKQGIGLTPLAFILKATAGALRAFPEMNSSLAPDGKSLILKDYIHIGMAVDIGEGLVVPVIRDVDQKGIYQLAREVIEVSGRMRDGDRKPEDFQGGTFTISSLGGIGGTAFTPIVNAPEVGILGVSRSSLKPVWRDGAFVPRLMLPLSLSYDHRVVDGAQAARFIVHLAGLLGDLRRLLL